MSLNIQVQYGRHMFHMEVLFLLILTNNFVNFYCSRTQKIYSNICFTLFLKRKPVLFAKNEKNSGITITLAYSWHAFFIFLSYDRNSICCSIWNYCKSTHHRRQTLWQFIPLPRGWRGKNPKHKMLTEKVSENPHFLFSISRLFEKVLIKIALFSWLLKKESGNLVLQLPYREGWNC